MSNEKKNKGKKILKIIVHIITFTILISILTFLLIGKGGVVSRNKGLSAQQKLDEAIQKYSQGECTDFFEAIKSIDGYKSMEDIGEGFYIVNIDGAEVMVSHK